MPKTNWDSYEWVMEVVAVVFGTLIFYIFIAPLIPQYPEGGFSWIRAFAGGIFVAVSWRVGHIAGTAIDRALK